MVPQSLLTGQPERKGKAIRWPPSACRDLPKHWNRGNPFPLPRIDPMDGRCPSAPTSLGDRGNPITRRCRKRWHSTVGTPLRETGATRMYRSGGSDGRTRFMGGIPWKDGGQPLSAREFPTSKHHTPDGSRSSRGTGQPDPHDVTTQIQGPTKAGIGATRYPISIGPLEQEEITIGSGKPEPVRKSFW